MNLNEIILLAIRNLDEDPQDISQFEVLFTAYANMGYRIATVEYCKPRQAYPIHTDDKGKAVLAFSNVYGVILARLADSGREVPFEISEDGRTITLPGAKDKDVEVLCAVTYPMLDDMKDKPKIPAWLHPALADYICYRYLSTGNLAKQQRAQSFLMQFNQALSMVRRQGYGDRTAMRNLYTASDIRA